MYILEIRCAQIYGDRSSRVKIYDNLQRGLALREYKKECKRLASYTSEVTLYDDSYIIESTINFNCNSIKK